MSWAARRRFIILLILGGGIAVIVAGVLFATFVKDPSCVDGIQNQDEAGVDCGGGCAYLCTAQVQLPTVLFTKAFSYGAERTDVVALIENKNINAAAKNVEYSITLYGNDQALIQQITGTLDLPPGTQVPVYVPKILSGKQTVTRAFLDIATSSLKWFSMPANQRAVPRVTHTTQSGTEEAPRVEAVLENITSATFNTLQVVVIVHSTSGEVIAVSTTVIPSISPQGEATAVFTWNTAFSETPGTIEVIPIIPLP